MDIESWGTCQVGWHENVTWNYWENYIKIKEQNDKEFNIKLGWIQGMTARRQEENIGQNIIYENLVNTSKIGYKIFKLYS